MVLWLYVYVLGRCAICYNIFMMRSYIAIDLKSFYASVECVERGLDPLKARLVVADESRTDKTICLAVSPALKALGISGRARLYEVKQKAKDFIIAVPRMAYYISYSTRIYNIYLRYVAEEDMHVYSIDEVFIDATPYLKNYKMSARELATKIVKDVLAETGVTATVGIGTNMYLAKIAMDIVAKHADANEFGVRIAELDEISYRKLLWDHRPITDFWRVGKGISTQLAKHSIYTMGDVARASLEREDLLYKLFGVNAEFLIDHAWGLESCTMQDVKKYRPKVKSLSSGQVLPVPYDYEHTKLIVKEMTDHLVLDLVSKSFVTDQLVLDIGYDVENLNFYQGETTLDYYGRRIPKHAHGTIRLDTYTSSTKIISKKMIQLFEQIINQDLLVRRIVVVAGNLASKKEIEEKPKIEQLDLFSSVEENVKNASKLEEENQLQKTILSIKYKFGKNSILKGMNLEEGGTAIERGKQIGGHRE